MDLSNVLRWAIPNMDERQRERAVKLFLRKGTSFAVVEGVLFMSATSSDILQDKMDHVFLGVLDCDD